MPYRKSSAPNWLVTGSQVRCQTNEIPNAWIEGHAPSISAIHDQPEHHHDPEGGDTRDYVECGVADPVGPAAT